MQRLLHDFPIDLLIAFELGVTRAMAAPAICKIFLKSESYSRNGNQRQALILSAVAELIQLGLDDPRSNEILAGMRQAHRQYHVPDDYVLYSFTGLVTGPIRWIDRFGWRKLKEEERQGLGLFWHEVANRLELPDPPRTVDAWFALQKKREQELHHYSPENHELAETLREVFVRRLPPVSRPMGRVAFVTVLDPDLLPHLGWRRPSLVCRGFFLGGIYLYSALARFVPLLRGKNSLFREELIS